MTVVVVDEKYRILLDKELRETAGVSKGDKLLAIPYKGGVLLLSLKGKSFEGSLKGFRYAEEQQRLPSTSSVRSRLRRMPIIDTVILFAAADEEDPHHQRALRYIEDAPSADLLVASFILLEFDIVLNSRGYSFDERMEKHALLQRDFPHVNVRSSRLRPSTFFLAAKIEKEVGLEYFDAGVAAEALQHDRVVISTDKAFEKVASLERVW